jgi:hypothetical protein
MDAQQPPPVSEGTRQSEPNWTPPNLLSFVGREHENFLVSLANNRDDLAIVTRLQGLFEAVMSHKSIPNNDVPIVQLLTFAHYHFLYSTANLMRCRLSEAFSSVRTAIDSALVAAMIIHDRASQEAYSKREHPFDKLARYYKNLIKDKKPLPHRAIPDLLHTHDICSMFASHADVSSFMHRVSMTPEIGPKTLLLEYFQFSRDEDERQIHSLNLFHTFVMILDVFSDYLVVERKLVPEEWRKALYDLGGKIERHTVRLRAQVAAKTGQADHPPPSDSAPSST